jgi:anti-sigma regulatory factor (Ser/Thr protein kinase)
VDELTLPARLDSVGEAVRFVSALAAVWSVNPLRTTHLELATEEAVANVCRHAYPGSNGDLTVRAWRDGDRVSIEIVDHGVPFDPTAAPPPDLASSLEERAIGGLGITMILDLMDEVAYRRDGDRNVLTMAVADSTIAGPQ